MGAAPPPGLFKESLFCLLYRTPMTPPVAAPLMLSMCACMLSCFSLPRIRYMPEPRPKKRRSARPVSFLLHGFATERHTYAQL